MGAYTSAQMLKYNRETVDRLKNKLADLEKKFESAGMDTRIFFSEVSFDQVKPQEVNRFLNSLPTSLELDDMQVDKLIGTGRLMLRSEPAYMTFKQRNKARMADGSITDDEICQQFDHDSCELLGPL